MKSSSHGVVSSDRLLNMHRVSLVLRLLDRNLHAHGARSPESEVNLLERKALRLRHEEIDERNRKSNAAPKHEVRPVPTLPQIGNHIRHRTGNGEVENPVRGGANRHSAAADAQGENLRAVDPGNTGVREAEADGEDVDERDGRVASGAQAAAATFARCGDFDVGADEPHGDEHHGRARHEHVPSAEAVDDEVHGDDDADEADNAVDSCGV